MNLLIVLTGLCTFATWKLMGFSVISIFATVSWILFSGRRFGYFCKMNTIFVFEGLGIFFTLVWRLMTQHFSIKVFLILFVIRTVYILFVRHDVIHYVYVTEERRRDTGV